MKFTPTAAALHATVTETDLAKPLGSADISAIEHALAKYGVLSFPGQQLTPQQFRRFSNQFGELEINVANKFHEPGIPEMMILSNMVDNGRPVGMVDAGQGWHTDLSYREVVGYATILYGLKIPHRDGEPLGCTEFCNMAAAYDDLPQDIKTRLQGMTLRHDFAKFWDMMRLEKGSPRSELTPEQRAARPPASHPIFLEHPISGCKVLYANPGYSVRINEISQGESDKMLAYLFAHQTQPKFKYRHPWSVGDVLMWDNIGTIHNAVADYTAEEPRLLKRCQVIGSRLFTTA
jgi:taurine dioxygenase